MTDKIDTVLECSEVSFDRIILNKMEMGDMMLSTRPYYDYEGSPYKKISLAFRTPFVNITQDGIPDIHEIYCPDDSKRLYIRLPLDPTQPISEFITMHEEFDNYFKEQVVRETLFGKAAKNYDYTPSIKRYKAKVQEDEEDEFTTKKTIVKKLQKPIREYHPSVRYLFNTEFGSNNKLTTEFWIKDSEDAPATQIFPNTVTELKQHVPFGSRVSCVVTLSKVWGEKNKKDERVPFKLYSIKFNVQNMCIIPKKNIVMSTFWSGSKFWNSNQSNMHKVAIPNSNIRDVQISTATATAIGDIPIGNLSLEKPNSYNSGQFNMNSSSQKSASPNKKPKTKAKTKARASPNNSDNQELHDPTCEEVSESD